MKRLMALGLSLAALCGQHVLGAMAYEKAATVYDGAVMRGDAPVGVIQVKVGKASPGKNGVVSATVQLSDAAKALSFKKGAASLDGAVTDMSAGGKTLKLTLGEMTLDGTLGDLVVVGGRSLATSKDKSEKAAAAAAAAKWLPGFAVARRSDKGWDGFSVTLDKKGSKVKVGGKLAGSKKKLNGKGAFFLRDGRSVALAVVNKNAQLSFSVKGAQDGSGSVDLAGLDHATAGKIAGVAGVQVVPTAGLPEGYHYGPGGAPEDVKVKTNAKTGEVTATFTVYQTVNGKEKKVKAKVTGMLVNGVVYANAEVGKADSVPVTIQSDPETKPFNENADGQLTPEKKGERSVKDEPAKAEPVQSAPVDSPSTDSVTVTSTPVDSTVANPASANSVAKLPDWAVGTFNGVYVSNWSMEGENQLQSEAGDFSFTVSPDGSVDYTMTIVDKIPSVTGQGEKTVSMTLAGKLAFVAAHQEPDALDANFKIDVPDSCVAEAEITFPSGKILPIAFLVYKDAFDTAVWEIGADDGANGCFWFVQQFGDEDPTMEDPAVDDPMPVPLTPVEPAVELPDWAVGTFSGVYGCDWLDEDDLGVFRQNESGNLVFTVSKDGSVDYTMTAENTGAIIVSTDTETAEEDDSQSTSASAPAAPAATVASNTLTHITWYTSKTDAVAAAKAAGKRILLVVGRNSCRNTQAVKDSIEHDLEVNVAVTAGYVCWYDICDSADTVFPQYFSISGSVSLPLMCVIDPASPDASVIQMTGYRTPAKIVEFLTKAASIPTPEPPPARKTSSLFLIGNLTFVPAHQETYAMDENIKIDVPDYCAIEANVVFPSGKTQPIVFRVSRDYDGMVIWEIGTNGGENGFWFAQHPDSVDQWPEEPVDQATP